MSFFDRDWNLLPFGQLNHPAHETAPKKPAELDEMVRIAETLAAGFQHVRVDLYDVGGRVYFGEMTFTSASGIIQWDPPETDKLIGAHWNLQPLQGRS